MSNDIEIKLEFDLIENQIRYLKVIVNARFTSVSGWRGIDLIYNRKRPYCMAHTSVLIFLEN